jgi:hypothetical protein
LGADFTFFCIRLGIQDAPFSFDMGRKLVERDARSRSNLHGRIKRAALLPVEYAEHVRVRIT